MNWSHLKTILWLRWRMTRNRHRRAGAWETFSRRVIGLVLILGCLAGATLGFFGGSFPLLREAPSGALLFAFDLLVGFFLLFWLIGLLTELQRAESIDLARLLHLPISLKEGFVFNYVAALATPAVYFLVASGVGLTIGLMVSRGFLLVLMLAPLAGLVLFVTSWTYCLRGWIAGWMSNPRRKKTVIMVATLTVILVFQLPNLFFQLNLRKERGKGERPSPERAFDEIANHPQLLLIHAVFPPGWPGLAARGLAENNPVPLVLTCIGSLAVGGLGLMVGYRGARRLYCGTGGGRPATSAATVATAPRRSRANFVARELPWLRGDTSALALANFRSLIRAPEVRIALVSYVAVMVVVGASMLARGSGDAPAALKLFLPSGLAVFTVFGIMQVMGNQFGFDRDGFRALVLLPLPRNQVLFAKNLSFLPILIGLGWVVLPVVAVVVGVPWTTTAAGLIHLLTIYALVAILGNYSSIAAPYRVAAGALKKSKPPAKVVFIMLGVFIATPIFSIPVLVPPLIELLQPMLFGTEGIPFNLILSVFMLVIAGVLYFVSLAPLGRLLQRREREILQAVCQEDA